MPASCLVWKAQSSKEARGKSGRCCVKSNVANAKIEDVFM